MSNVKRIIQTPAVDTPAVDVQIHNEGSIFLFELLTTAGT